MSVGDPLRPSKMYSMLIVFHQPVQEEWIAGQQCKRHSQFCTPQWKENLHGMGGGETGRERYAGVIEVVGLCNFVNILSLFYFRFSFSALSGWILIFGNMGHLISVSISKFSRFMSAPTGWVLWHWAWLIWAVILKRQKEIFKGVSLL